MNVEIPKDDTPIVVETPQFNAVTDVMKQEEVIEVTSEEVETNDMQLPFEDVSEPKEDTPKCNV
jgi:hypothetical protein